MKEKNFSEDSASQHHSFETEAEPEWQEDIFSAAWGEKVADSDFNGSESETESESVGSTYEAQTDRVRQAFEAFSFAQGVIFSLLSSSRVFASCCLGVVHFHGGIGNVFGGLPGIGNHSGDHDHDHHHEDEHYLQHAMHSIPKVRSVPIKQPLPPDKPRQVEMPKPKTQGSISLGTLVASFASPAILAA